MPLLDLPAPAATLPPGADDKALDRALAELGEVEPRLVDIAVAGVCPGAPSLERVDCAISLLDLTTLEGTDTPGRVRELCATARVPEPRDDACPRPAAVCVYSDLVGVAAEALGDTPLLVAAVAGGFPAGRMPTAVRVADVRAAVEAGADEVDVVIDRGAVLDGRWSAARDQLVALGEAAGAARLKVILEAGELGDLTVVRRAAWLAFAAGADMVKTATGKIAAGSTPALVAVLAETARQYEELTARPVGVKAAGGVRTVEQAVAHLAVVEAVGGSAWLTPERFRIGASSLLGALVSVRG